MSSNVLSFLSNGPPNYNPKVATADEAKKIADAAKSFFDNDYSFPSCQTQTNDFFPALNPDNQVQYISTNSAEVDLESDLFASDDKNSDSVKRRNSMWTLFNTAFSTNSIYLFQKCLCSDILYPSKKITTEMKSNMNSILKTLSNSNNFPGFYPDPNFSAKIPIRYEKLASTTAFAVSTSEIFIGSVFSSDSSLFGQIEVYNINFYRRQIINETEKVAKSRTSTVLFPPILKLKRHEHFSIVYINNIIYQIFDSMIRIKPLDKFDTELQKYEGIIELKKHESPRYPSVTDGNKIYSFDTRKKSVSIFSVEIDCNLYNNDDNKENILIPKYEKTVSLSFPIVIIDPESLIMATDGSVFTIGFFNTLKKEYQSNLDESSSTTSESIKSSLIKYHFYTFSLVTGKLIQKVSQKFESIIDAWCFNPFKISQFVLTRNFFKMSTGVATVPRWIEGYSTPVVEKKGTQQVIDAFELAVYEGSTFFSDANSSAYQESFNTIFNSSNVHLLKPFVNLFITNSPEVDDVISTLNNEYARSVKFGLSRLLFFCFLAILPRSTIDLSENNFASQFIEGNDDLDIIFLFPSIFNFEKLPLTQKANNKIFMYALEKENQFPMEALQIAKKYCISYALKFMNEEDYSIIKDSIEKVFDRINQYIDFINDKKLPADYFKKTATIKVWTFFVNQIARHKSVWIYYADSILNTFNFSISKSAPELNYQMNLSLILYLEILTSLPHQTQEGYFTDLDEFYNEFENPLNGIDRKLDSQLFELLNYAFNLSKKKMANCLFKCRQFIKFDKETSQSIDDYIKKVGLLDYLIVENTKILLPIKTKKFSDEFLKLFSENSKNLNQEQLIIFSFYSSRLGKLVFSISKEKLTLIKDFSLFFDVAMITKQLVEKHQISFSIMELLTVEGDELESKYNVLIELKDHITNKYLIFKEMKNETFDNSKNVNYMNLSQISKQPYHYTLWVIFYLALQTSSVVSMSKKSASSPYPFQRTESKSDDKKSRETSALNLNSNDEFSFKFEDYLDIFRAHLICGNPSIIRMIMKCISHINTIIEKKSNKMNPIFSFLMSLLKQYISGKTNPFILQSQPATTIESIFIIIQYMKEMFNNINGPFRTFFIDKVKKANTQEKALPIFAILNNSIEVVRPNVEVHLIDENLEQIVGTVIQHNQPDARATIRKINMNKDQTRIKLKQDYYVPDIEVNLSKCTSIWCSCPTIVKLDEIEDLTMFVQLFFNVPIEFEGRDQSETFFANSFRFASLWEFISSTSIYDLLSEDQINKIIHKRSFPSSFCPEMYLFDFGFYMGLRWMKFSPFTFIDINNTRNIVSRSPVVNNLVMKQRQQSSGMMTTLFDSATFVSPPIHPMNKMKICIYLFPKEKALFLLNKRRVRDLHLTVFGLTLPFNCVLESDEFCFDASPNDVKEIVIEFCPKLIAFKVFENGTLIKKTLGSPSIGMYFITIDLESNNIAEYHVQHTTKRTDESQICLSKAFAFAPEGKVSKFKVDDDEDEEEEEEEIDNNNNNITDSDQYDVQFDDFSDQNFMKITDKKVFTQMNDSSVFNELCLRDSASGLIDSFRTLITIHHLKKTKTRFPFCILNLFASIDPYPSSQAFSMDEIVPTPHFRETTEYIFNFIKEYVDLHREEIVDVLYNEIKLKYIKDCNRNRKQLNDSKILDYEKTNKNLFCITNENRSALLIKKNQYISISNCIVFSASSKKPLKIVGLFEDDVKIYFSHPGIIIPYLNLSGSIIDYLIHLRHIMSISISLQNYDFQQMISIINKLEHSGRYFTPLFHEFVEILNVINPKVPPPNNFPTNLNPLSFLVNSSLVHEKPELFLLTSYCEFFGNRIHFTLGRERILKKLKYLKSAKNYQLYISIHDNLNCTSHDVHRFEFELRSNPPTLIKTNSFVIVDSEIVKSLTFECITENIEPSELTFVICKVPKIDKITSDLKEWKPHHTHQLLSFLFWKINQDDDKGKKKKKEKCENQHCCFLLNNEFKFFNALNLENYELLPISTRFSFKTAKFILEVICKIVNIITSFNDNIAENNENNNNDDDDYDDEEYDEIRHQSESDILNISDNSDDKNDNQEASKSVSVFKLDEENDNENKNENENENKKNNNDCTCCMNITDVSKLKLFFYFFHIIEGCSKDKAKTSPILAPFEYFRRICDHTFLGPERVSFLKKNELTFSAQLNPDSIRINFEFPLFQDYEDAFHSKLRPNTLIKYIHEKNIDNEMLIKKLLKFLRKSPAIVLLQFIDFCTGLWGTGWILGKDKGKGRGKRCEKTNCNLMLIRDQEIVDNYINHFDNNYDATQNDKFDPSQICIYVHFSKKQEQIESYQPGNILILGDFVSGEKLTSSMLKKLQEYTDMQMS